MADDRELPGMDWTSQLEKRIKILGESAMWYKLMHIEAARKSFNLYNSLMYCSIIMGPAAAVISGIGVTLNPEAPTLFPVISSIVAFIAGVFPAIVKFAKFDQVADAHIKASAKFTSLESNIRRQLMAPRAIRKDASQYSEYINFSYDNLISSSPLLPRQIVKEFDKKYKKNDDTMSITNDSAIVINQDWVDARAVDTANTDSIEVYNEKTIDKNTDSTKPIKKLEHVESPAKLLSSLKSVPVPEYKYYSGENMEYKLNSLPKLLSSSKLIPLTEYNSHSDGMMDYELKRLIDHKIT